MCVCVCVYVYINIYQKSAHVCTYTYIYICVSPYLHRRHHRTKITKFSKVSSLPNLIDKIAIELSFENFYQVTKEGTEEKSTQNSQKSAHSQMYCIR